MRNKSIYAVKIALFSVSLSVFIVPLFFAVGSTEAEAPVSLGTLREQVQALAGEAARLEEENQGLRYMLKALEDNNLYLVVDTESNQLTMRKGNRVLHTAVCGTGSRMAVEEEAGRNWFFETPQGTFTVLGRERNPVWIRPDWSYVEENMPVPALNDPDRIVRGVLGKYALLLGSGYKIHGTTYTHLLGTHYTHGCIALGDADLELVHKSARIGTKVYIY